MLEKIPRGAKVLVVAGGDGAWRRDLETRGGEEGAARVRSWDLRTSLSETDAKVWAASSAMSRASGGRVLWVVFFNDGSIGGDDESCGFADWSFEVIKIASFLLSHGAQFVYTADDAYNPSMDPSHPGLVFPLPGPGMFAAMMRKLMFPHAKDRVACAGKGGNQGGRCVHGRQGRQPSRLATEESVRGCTCGGVPFPKRLVGTASRHAVILHTWTLLPPSSLA